MFDIPYSYSNQIIPEISFPDAIAWFDVSRLASCEAYKKPTWGVKIYQVIL